jgi:PAS domain S-box-containing protein
VSEVHAEDEDRLLRLVALKNANSILLARRRAEQELVRAKDALEAKTQELAHSLSMMRATLESTSNGVLVTDEHGRITAFNDNYLNMWRISRAFMEKADHRAVVALVSRQFRDPQAFVERVEQIHASAPPQSSDVLELADGRVFERYSKIQIVEGRNVGRVWSFSDVTERRRAEEALREDARVLELLNRTGATLSSKLDLESLVQAVTDAATELSGARFGAFFYNTTDGQGNAYSLYTLAGAPREAFAGFGYPRATPIFAPTFNGEGPIRCEDVQTDPRYGKWPPHHGMPQGHLPVRSYLAVPVISRSGEVIGGLFFGHPDPGVFTERDERLIAGVAAQAAIAIDNARLYEAAQQAAEERKQLLESERHARAEAERASAMKDEFLATLSHELRTPLSAILGWSQILRLRHAPGELEQGLETIERNARVQTQLIEDLLDMSRIASGKLRLDMQQLQPASLLEAAIETVQPAATAKGIRLEKTLDASAGPVSGDPNRLQQVVWNLLSNAIKFTPRGGHVHVGLARVNSSVAISVSDSGIGIKPEFLPNVFDRFRQADSSTTRVHGGLGLGLSIVKRLVELHGGSVRVESEGEGRGATFMVLLPCAPEQGAREPEQARIAPAGRVGFKLSDLSGVKVLVVDDEPDARELIRRVLTECEAEVLTAASATEALALLEHEAPDVLVTDIGMPEIDGYELLRRVRVLRSPHGRKIPAIALTAFARSEDRTRALRAGFLVHVSKPVEPAELVATVASVAGRIGEPELK